MPTLMPPVIMEEMKIKVITEEFFNSNDT